MSDMYRQRREKLRSRLRDLNLDAYLVLHPANRFYLSGFELHDPQCNESAGALVITARDRDWLCTDPRFEDAAKRVWAEDDLMIYRNKRVDSLTEFLAQQGFGSLGFESRIISHEFFASLQERLTLSPQIGLVEELRTIKDADEIARLRSSCALNHQVFSSLPDILEPGLTEAEVAWKVECLFREHGASELAFAPIVALDANAALPHSIPGQATLGSQSLLLVDVGGRCRDYCSDQTRTFWVGQTPSDGFRRTLDLVQQAQKEAISQIRPGLEIKDLYQAARNFFERHQVADRFTHALGHGIGLETHEFPGLGPKAEGILQPGMVITIEPGLYYPQWGGVRWEHMVLVTEDGAEIL